MTTASLSIVAPGLHTTVQDLGRWGFQASGVPVSGAMDVFSHRLANALVGNERSAATLEITLSGPELEFEDERMVAIAGATLSAQLDGAPAPHEELFVVRRGSRLRFGSRVEGARAYLGVSGGIDVPVVLGSRSTHAASGIGGHEGRALARGDTLALGATDRVLHAQRGQLASRSWRDRRTSHYASSAPGGFHTVRVLPGPHVDRFSSDALERLQAQPYRVSSQANRMGYRLEGPGLTHTRGADIISDVTAHGSLQVPGAGVPILLMADRQTTGGYPCVATTISADIPVAAQIAPGERISFRVCDAAEAATALIARERTLLAIEGDR